MRWGGGQVSRKGGVRPGSWILERSLVTLVSWRQRMSASSLSKMRAMTMAVEWLGSSACRGLRIPLMFQLTTRSMAIPNRWGLPARALRGTRERRAPPSPLARPWGPSGFPNTTAQASSDVPRNGGTHVGGASSPSVPIGYRRGSCRGRGGRLGE